MSAPLNLKPYTVVPGNPGDGYAVHSSLHGYTVLADDISVSEAAEALNDAYTKGVESERARREAAIEANLSIGEPPDSGMTPELRAAMVEWAKTIGVKLPAEDDLLAFSWSDLTEGAQASIRDWYIGMTESERRATLWTKHGDVKRFTDTNCLWEPVKP